MRLEDSTNVVRLVLRSFEAISSKGYEPTVCPANEGAWDVVLTPDIQPDTAHVAHRPLAYPASVKLLGRLLKAAVKAERWIFIDSLWNCIMLPRVSAKRAPPAKAVTAAWTTVCPSVGARALLIAFAHVCCCSSTLIAKLLQLLGGLDASDSRTGSRP